MKKVLIAILIVVILVSLVSLGTFLYLYKIGAPVTMDGLGMAPTINSGKVVHVVKYPKGQTPQRGDIVEYKSSNALVKQSVPSGKLIHRVVALPGERVTVNSDKVLVYNAQHPSGFDPASLLASGTITTSVSGFNIDTTLGPHTYFLMGDNQPHALDSRIIGPIPLSDIIGKVKQP